MEKLNLEEHDLGYLEPASWNCLLQGYERGESQWPCTMKAFSQPSDVRSSFHFADDALARRGSTSVSVKLSQNKPALSAKGKIVQNGSHGA